MFQAHWKNSKLDAAVNLLELIYHATVRNMRKTHRSAVMGLITNIMQSVVMVAIFYVMFSLLGLRGSAVRGDFLLYVMSGIFLFLTHTKAMAAVAGSEGATAPMMQHAPMNTVVSIASSALAALYTQILSILVILFVYHAVIKPITIFQPMGALGMVLLAWFSGVAVGMVFLALKPWAPGFVAIATTIYARANMIASGKMFLANTLPGYMLAMFDWNPLFHAIDQARGFVFLNYNPHFSSVSYAVYTSLALIMIGLMGEFFTRKNASLSWSAGR